MEEIQLRWRERRVTAIFLIEGKARDRLEVYIALQAISHMSNLIVRNTHRHYELAVAPT